MENQLRANAVKQPRNVQAFLREQIVILHLGGIDTHHIATTLGVSERHVRNTLKKYREGGLTAIQLGQAGRKVGEKRKLTPEQELEIQEIIRAKSPSECGFKESVWFRKTVQAMIKKLYHIELCETCVGNYLRRWGMSPQRPVKRARKQDEQQVKDWKENKFPEIKTRASEEKANIFFLLTRQERKTTLSI